MKIKRIETFCDPFVGFVRVTAQDGSQGTGSGCSGVGFLRYAAGFCAAMAGGGITLELGAGNGALSTIFGMAMGGLGDDAGAAARGDLPRIRLSVPLCR